MIAALQAGLALASLWLAYVLPWDRVLAELVAGRALLEGVRIEARVLDPSEALEPDPPVEESLRSAVIELHPELGMRVADDRGGRWLIRGGRVHAGIPPGVPPWLPDLEILVLRQEEDLLAWFQRAGVNLKRVDLARCGEAHCFVLGGRDGSDQLWLDKNRFEVVRLVSYFGASVELERYRDWSGFRFPSEIRILGPRGAVATLRVIKVSTPHSFSEEDFSPQWVEGSLW